MIKYINLTAGIEWLEKEGMGFEFRPFRFLHLQSSHLEQKAYGKFFDSIPDDLLINLALRETCLIYDASSSKSGISKVIRIGIPLIKTVLNYLWFGKLELSPKLDPKQQFKALYEYSEDFKRRVKFAKQFLITDEIRLAGRPLRIEREDSAYLIRVLRDIKAKELRE